MLRAAEGRECVLVACSTDGELLAGGGDTELLNDEEVRGDSAGEEGVFRELLLPLLFPAFCNSRALSKPGALIRRGATLGFCLMWPVRTVPLLTLTNCLVFLGERVL